MVNGTEGENPSVFFLIFIEDSTLNSFISQVIYSRDS